MRKRVMFQKGICSLLALLLAFSSLMALPVLAAGEDGEAPAEVEQADTPVEKEETSEKAEPEETDKPEKKVESEETDKPAEEVKSEETGEPAEDVKPGETGEPADETGSEGVTDPDKADEPADKDNEAVDEAEEADGLENADKPEIEEMPGDEEDAEAEEVLEEELELMEAVQKLQAMPMMFSLRDRGPVYVENDTLVLRTSAAYYLQAHLVFSSDPTKDFVLEVSSPQQYRFLCNWTEINDRRVSVEVTPPMDNFTATLYLSFDFLKAYGITLSREDGITFNNQRYSFSDLDLDLPGDAGQEKEEQPKDEDLPPYEGITIDGNFDDWASVSKKELTNPNAAWSCAMQSAVVWDGDYVYIYFHVNDGNANAIGAMGPHSNGQFAITTDIGNVRLVQADFGNNSVEIFEIPDALVAVDNYGWDPVNGHSTEIAIPTSCLPPYKTSISFGFYLVEPFLKNIQNFSPVQEEITESGEFACDGEFGEWTYYPHTTIEYDTSGIQHSKVDGGAALHVENGILYGHVKTAHRDHLEEVGSEFLAAIEIAFNGDLTYKDLPEKGNFYPKMLTTDGSTTVNEGTGNEKGITTYLISDTRETTPEPGPFFGTMKIKVTGTIDEMEFAIDLVKVADYISCNADDIKTVHARFGRIGDEWVSTGGTPTGPVLGLALCFSTVGGVYAVDRRKKKKK